MKIKVVDAICGKGKTSYCIQRIMMDRSKFIYVTPYLDEVKRVIDSCKTANIKVSTPEARGGGGSKSEHFKKLIVRGANIVMTHSLFGRIDEDSLELLRSGGYTLYMDEVHEVVKSHNISEEDFDMLETSHNVIIDEMGKVEWITEDYTGKFEEFRNLCKLGCMYHYSGKLFFWCFPIDVFKAMKEVYIFTYCFEGQLQCAYYKMNKVEYEMLYVVNDDGIYDLRPYSIQDTIRDIQEVAPLINIYDGNLNFEKGMSLSSKWFNNNKEDKAVVKFVKNCLYNYFRHKVSGSNSNENMWTTLKSMKDKLKGCGYTKGFVPSNARATNEYRHKVNLAYMYNKYMNPTEKRFFSKHGVDIDEDLFALSELLQWIFRSAIRDNKPINIYLPSMRMRNLLINWINKK